MKNPDQKMRFTDAELALTKGVFAGNDELLSAIRKVFLQFPLSEQEEGLVKNSVNEQVYALVRKFFLPDLDPEAPLFQLTDMYLGIQSDMKLGPDLAWPHILAKELEMDYIAQQLAILKDITAGTKPKMYFDGLKGRTTKTRREEAWVRITARNFILSYVDSNIQQMKFLAGLKDETVEQTKERLAKDSNK